MAYSFGGGIRPELGKTDYSGYLQGALTGARGVAAGGAAIGQGIQNFGAGIAKGVKGYYEKKEKDEKNQFAVDTIVPLLATREARIAAGIPPDVTDEVLRKTILKQVTAFGAEASLGLATQFRNSAAFGKGIAETPSSVLKNIETEEADLSTLPFQQPITFTVPSIRDGVRDSVPQQSVYDFMETGKNTPQVPAMAIDMFRNQPAAPDAALEPPAIKPVPDNLKPYFVFNPQTESLVSTKKFNQDTLEFTKEFQSLEQEKEKINEELNRGFRQPDPIAAGRRFGQLPGDPDPFMGEEIKVRTQRLNEIEKQQTSLKNTLLELNNAREFAVDFSKQPNEKPSVEKTASNVIDRSLRFAEEVNLGPVEKNQWMQMKKVLKTVSRNATDEEKIAGFIKGYSSIAPIDESVYLKMNQLFDKTPVITNLGEGNTLVTVNGKSFILESTAPEPIAVSEKNYQDENSYLTLLSEARRVGLAELKENHKPMYNRLWELNIKFGRTNALTGGIISLEEVLRGETPQLEQLGQPPQTPQTPRSNNTTGSRFYDIEVLQN